MTGDKIANNKNLDRERYSMNTLSPNLLQLQLNCEFKSSFCYHKQCRMINMRWFICVGKLASELGGPVVEFSTTLTSNNLDQ